MSRGVVLGFFVTRPTMWVSPPAAASAVRSTSANPSLERQARATCDPPPRVRREVSICGALRERMVVVLAPLCASGGMRDIADHEFLADVFAAVVRYACEPAVWPHRLLG